MIADRLRRAVQPPSAASERGANDAALSWAQWANMFTQFGYQGVQYTVPGQAQEQIGWEFESLTQLAYRGNGVVSSCMDVRMHLFSEARFQYQRMKGGRPGDLFGTQDLAVLEEPWPTGTTGDLLARMIQHSDLAGNFFCTTRNGQIRVLRPDWMVIVLGSDNEDDLEPDPWDPSTSLVGYAYTPGGYKSGTKPIVYLPNEICHFAPKPDPIARYRGMSWITPIIRDIMGDKAATEHKLKFFENAGTPNMVVSLNEPDLTKFKGWMDSFREQHEGVANAYKTLFLGAGADATVVGKDLQQMEFKMTQGAGETRIAAAAGVPPVIVGLSEGLQAATYSNYELAMRRFADLTMRPLWRNAAGSLANIIPKQTGARLWYDDRDVPALAEDQLKQADTRGKNAITIRQLVDAGYRPDDVVSAVVNNDFTLLEHSGLFSVQLQPANAPKQGLFQGTTVPAPGAPAPAQPGTQSQPKAAANGREE